MSDASRALRLEKRPTPPSGGKDAILGRGSVEMQDHRSQPGRFLVYTLSSKTLRSALKHRDCPLLAVGPAVKGLRVLEERGLTAGPAHPCIRVFAAEKPTLAQNRDITASMAAAFCGSMCPALEA